MGVDNDSDILFSMMNDNTAKLTSAVQSLPQLLARKKLIDMHTTIATGTSHYYSFKNTFSFESRLKFSYPFEQLC